ncbi:hypothetical protein HanXRQr2_Chr03g0105001 [Helianthus annuus]|uniref:Uncharacterized protein n=1 Tax=Helianthus annuus TaxID=4232 RepID=A0A251V6X2_HELAN|nr:hypothetical protein HanXRQr2_Chr03g0105001 [Helianthus annuus]
MTGNAAWRRRDGLLVTANRRRRSVFGNGHCAFITTVGNGKWHGYCPKELNLGRK